MTAPAATLPERLPEPGELVEVRSRRWLVEEVVAAPVPGQSALVRLACADDDAQGQALDVYWDYEPDRLILEEEGWANLASRGFDPPRRFAAFLHTLRWGCVTATDPNLFQSPFRAGIKIDAYQMEPLRKALRLPRVALFIADDTGLGKTIEAGLIARELLLRRKAKAIVVFPLSTHAAFCALQSRPHEIWARFFGSSMKDDLRYTPSDCFETFPFPETWETHPALEAAGKAYYDFRAALMVRSGEGLTKTYNRFHAPGERSPEIAKLRDLHAAMDRAVLDAYGWPDLPTDCKFLLDYEIDDDEWGDKKKPWRYRWPDDVQAELLARLLDLSATRARSESRSGTAARANPRGRKAATRPPARNSDNGELF